MATFQEGNEVTSAEDDPDWKAAWEDISGLLQPRAVPWAQPLHQEETGLIHHHPGLPALPCQVSGQSAGQMLLHPSPNCAEGLVHVHSKEETGIAELLLLWLLTSGLPLLHMQGTEGQVQMGAGSGHHGHSTQITAHICGALHTLWPDAHPQQLWGFPLPCGDHWAKERVGAHQVSGLHPKGSQDEAVHCPRPKQRELVHQENHGHKAGHHPHWLLHPHACHPGVFIALPLWAWCLTSSFKQCFPALFIDICWIELADLNKWLPPEAWLPPAKPVARPTHLERQLSVHTPHHHAATILLPKPTVPQEAACSLLPGLNPSNTAPTMASTVVLIGILVYTDLAAQVIEHLWVRAPWLPCLYLVMWCLPATQIPPSPSSHLTPLSHPRTRHGRGSCPGPVVHLRVSKTAQPQSNLGAWGWATLEETVLQPLANTLQLLQHHTGPDVHQPAACHTPRPTPKGGLWRGSTLRTPTTPGFHHGLGRMGSGRPASGGQTCACTQRQHPVQGGGAQRGLGHHCAAAAPPVLHALTE